MSQARLAESLAADLAGASVDPNEAQKALAYLRGHRDERQFFGYLRAVVSDGRAVIRSAQTLGYYRDLLAACERHLRGLPPEEMARTLGWAIRLLRYYRNVPNAERPVVVAASVNPSVVASTAPAPIHPPLQKPQIFEVGDTFTGKVLERDEALVVIEVPEFRPEVAVALLKVELGTPAWKPGKDTARVEVVRVRERDKLTILDVKRAASKSKGSE